LLANFMSISYTDYVPLCPDPRHHLYILPIGAMVLAYGFQNLSRVSLAHLLMSIGILLVLLLVSVYHAYENTWWLYLPLMGALVAGYKGQKPLFILALSMAFGSIYIQNVRYNKKVNYTSQKALNMYVIESISGQKYIITDRVNRDYGLFHSKFDTSETKFLDYTSWHRLMTDSEYSHYLIMNGMTSYLSNTSWESLPDFAKSAQDSLPKIFSNISGSVYKLK
ncbi:MAG: hypothetical protein WBO36_04260, partial [Saprospiraceae bacterium]